MARTVSKCNPHICDWCGAKLYPRGRGIMVKVGNAGMIYCDDACRKKMARFAREWKHERKNFVWVTHYKSCLKT